MDKVLKEVAEFNQPKLQDRGKYTLKKEEWRNFDPYFLHYARSDLEEALERAKASGVYKMEWSLRPPPRAPAFVERPPHPQTSPVLPRRWSALGPTVQMRRRTGEEAFDSQPPAPC